MALSNKEYLQINQALFSLTHAYETRMEAEEARNILGLRLSDCSVLMVMGQWAPITVSRLSELMDINRGTISVYVQRLVKMGLVKRKRDTGDRRTWWLTLTFKGRQAAAGVIDGAVEYTRGFLEPLNEDDREVLHRLLLKAAHGLGYEWQ